MQIAKSLHAPKFCCFLFASLFLLPACTQAQATSSPQAARQQSAEQRAAHAFDKARSNSLDLRAFLIGMPKGADLHNHLSGAIYAESWIRAGAEDNLCVTLTNLSFVQALEFTKNTPPQAICSAGSVPATQALKDQHLYDSLINAFSMRSFVPSPGVSGHDHFFDTFSKFGGTSPRHAGEWLDEVATRAAAQNEQYLELMETPVFSHAAAIAREIGWQDDLGKLREELLARGLRDEIGAARGHLDDAEAKRRKLEHCGEPNETSACQIHLRYIYQVLRGFPKEQVFAQTLLGFETISADPRFVGINFVMPEDGYTSMSDYALHMKMLDFLHGVYPKVHITLHAGELAPGLVSYEGLCCHIHLAVEQGHAERVGHGVDVMYEAKPYDLLKEMAAKHVMVEINLSSNDLILGVSGKDHPFPIYRKFGVPIALSTDDEGVSRIDLTHEYVRAVETYGLNYVEIKKMVRTNIEHSFLSGAALWSEPDVFTRVAAPCRRDSLGAENPSSSCAEFLKSNEKAQEQWELERRFRVFESGL